MQQSLRCCYNLAKRIFASLRWLIFRAELVAEPLRYRIPGGIQLDWTAAIKIGIINGRESFCRFGALSILVSQVVNPLNKRSKLTSDKSFWLLNVTVPFNTKQPQNDNAYECLALLMQPLQLLERNVNGKMQGSPPSARHRPSRAPWFSPTDTKAK